MTNDRGVLLEGWVEQQGRGRVINIVFNVLINVILYILKLKFVNKFLEGLKILHALKYKIIVNRNHKVLSYDY